MNEKNIASAQRKKGDYISSAYLNVVPGHAYSVSGHFVCRTMSNIIDRKSAAPIYVFPSALKGASDGVGCRVKRRCLTKNTVPVQPGRKKSSLTGLFCYDLFRLPNFL